MKKLVALSFILFLTGLQLSCKKTKEKADELTEFDINYSNDLTIPSASVAVGAPPVNFVTPDIATNSSSNFSNQKTSSDKVSEIKLTKFAIVVSSGNLDYLNSISIYIQTSGQAEVLLASKAVVPTGVSSFNLDLSDTNIKNYIIGSSFKLRASITFDAPITTSQTLKLNETMHVKATLL